MERRHIALSGSRTTVGLDPDFWKAIEQLSGGEWQQWVADRLATKPENMTRAGWLRCFVLKSYRDCCINNSLD